MLKRKILTLIFASLLSISLIAFWFVFTDGEELIAFFPLALWISLIAIPVILIYGLPVSFLSEKLTKQFTNNKRIFWALVIHVVFGFGFVFIAGLIFETEMLIWDFIQFWRKYEVFLFPSLVTSICFWGVDEVIRFYSLIKDTK
ncbi:hypothetical protein [Bacillus sp. SM2101]|uniref:hypothetical protein n=1 Tax=Bacillus sp. SM2101 TaxID=2805366 RepID=UPI001BDF080A|nr:hypothetical protein [Bacillus sp. SM2101]